MTTVQDVLELLAGHLRSERFDDAALLGSRVAAIHPELPEPWRLRGIALRNSGDLLAGLRLIGWALRLDPVLPGGRANLDNAFGQAEAESLEHIRSGRFAEAARVYRAVTRVAPDHDNAHRNLRAVAHLALARARSLMEEGKADEAIALSECVLGILPEDDELWFLAGSLARQTGRMEKARHHLRRAVVCNPAHGPVFSEIGQALAHAGQWRDAAWQEERATRLHPENAESHLRLGLAWKAGGERERALAAFTAADRLKPDNPVMLFNLGLAATDLGRWDEAATVFRRFLAVCPAQSRGSVQHLYAEEVAAQQPFQAAFHVRQGQCHRRKGRAAEALESFRAALTFDGGSVEAYRGLVWALQAVGRGADAVRMRRRGLAFHPADAELREECPETAPVVLPARPAAPSLPGGRPRWAIVPGLMRDLPAFTAILRHLLELRTRGMLDAIVVSTWTGQVSANPVLREALDRQGVVVTESAEPRPNPSGHTIHQMKAVLAALDLCPEDAFVVKLRTDKLDFSVPEDAATLETMLSGAQDLTVESGGGWPEIFQQRVSVSGGMLHRLFNHADQVYGGLRGDLAKLVNFDLRYVEIFQHLRPEQWWFSHPFIDHMPVFQDYFRRNRHRPYDHLEGRAFLGAALENDFFLEALVSYLVVLRKYYRVGWLRADSPLYEMADDALRGMTYRDWFFKALGPLGGRAFQGIVTTPMFYNDAWIGPFLNGSLQLDALGERVLAAHERVRDFSYHRDYRRHAGERQSALDAYAVIDPGL